jgi:glycosyltransferase involved in cell wall biosynthesis
MRIAIDASRTTTGRVTGTERYSLDITRALIHLNDTLDHPHHITLYFRDTPEPDLFPPSDNVTHKVITARRMWTHTAFAWQLFRDRPDVTWVPAHTLPFIFPGKATVTVHDIGYRVYPGAHPLRQRIPLEIYTRFSAWRANVVIADSAATAQDITRFYGTSPDKIEVVYPGVTIPLVGDIEATRAKYKLPERYWLYLGTLQPRKNIGMIVSAYHQWRAVHGELEIGLVLAGGKGWQFRENWVYGADIHLTGYIDEADKGALLAGAYGLVFPSLYEGFGFPVVEAMGVGTPVICADNSSLPEVGGDAVMFVKANNVMFIADRMNVLTEYPKMRAEMVRRGKLQAAKFTWEDAAWDVLSVLEELGGIG